MKAIIDLITSKTGNASIVFKDGNKTVDWSALTKPEQIKMVDALHSFHHLFSKFIKTE